MTIRFAGGAFLLLLVFSSCYEKQEGCLDISATNFDVAADKPCPDSCCVYPTLKMRFDHAMVLPDSVFNLTLNRFYPVPDYPEDSIAFSRIRYYVSEVRLYSGTEEFRVSDEITLSTNSGSLTVTDDFGRVEPGASSEPAIGTFPFTGSFDRIRFNFGLAPSVVSTDPEKVPSSHPLTPGADSTLWDPVEGFHSYYLEYFSEVSAVDSLTLSDAGTVSLDFVLSEPIEIPGGFDVILEFQANYLSWFNGTQPKSDDAQTLMDAILQNVSGSFLFQGYTLRSN